MRLMKKYKILLLLQFLYILSSAQLLNVDDYELPHKNKGSYYNNSGEFTLFNNYSYDKDHVYESCEDCEDWNGWGSTGLIEAVPSSTAPTGSSLGNYVAKYTRTITSVESGDHFAYKFSESAQLEGPNPKISIDLYVDGDIKKDVIFDFVLKKDKDNKFAYFRHTLKDGDGRKWHHIEGVANQGSASEYNPDIPLSEIDQLVIHFDVYNTRVNWNDRDTYTPSDVTYYFDNITIEGEQICNVNPIVTNNNDRGEGSLRQAIICANKDPDHSVITFQDASEPYNIYLTEAFEVIDTRVTIDGSYNLNGVDTNAIVFGSGIVSATDGLSFKSGSDFSLVSNIQFSGFPGVGIKLNNTNNLVFESVKVKNNRKNGIINFSSDYTTFKSCEIINNGKAKGLSGIYINYSNYCIVGTGNKGEGNLIQRNEGSGILLNQTKYVSIKGNIIGSENKGDFNGNISDGITNGNGSIKTVVGGRGLYDKNTIGENFRHGIGSLFYYKETDHNTYSANSFIYNYQSPIELGLGKYPANGSSETPVVTDVQYIGPNQVLVRGIGNSGSEIEVYKVDGEHIKEARIVANQSSFSNRVYVPSDENWELLISDFNLGESNFYAATATLKGATSEFSDALPLCFNPKEARFLTLSSPFCKHCVGALKAVVDGEGQVHDGQNINYTYNWYQVDIGVRKTGGIYSDLNFCDYEEYDILTPVGKGAQLNEICEGNYRVIVETGHDQCKIESDFKLNNENPYDCDVCQSNFAPKEGQTYIVSAWVHEDRSGNRYPVSYTYPEIRIIFYQGKDQLVRRIRPSGKYKMIDGWQKIEGTFRVPNVNKSGLNAAEMEIELYNPSSNPYPTYFDDLRVHPYKSNMKSFVYDKNDLKLVSELDENNYATYYEYDEEGQMVRVKRETERGVITISETRSNVKK